jgi:hypothetical protein
MHKLFRPPRQIPKPGCPAGHCLIKESFYDTAEKKVGSTQPSSASETCIRKCQSINGQHFDANVIEAACHPRSCRFRVLIKLIQRNAGLGRWTSPASSRRFCSQPALSPLSAGGSRCASSALIPSAQTAIPFPCATARSHARTNAEALHHTNFDPSTYYRRKLMNSKLLLRHILL